MYYLLSMQILVHDILTIYQQIGNISHSIFSEFLKSFSICFLDTMCIYRVIKEEVNLSICATHYSVIEDLNMLHRSRCWGTDSGL